MEFHVLKMRPEDVPEVSRVSKLVSDEVAQRDNSWYGHDDERSVMRILDGGVPSWVFKCEERGTMTTVGAVLVQHEEETPGVDTMNGEVDDVVKIYGVFVLPQYRGHNLQLLGMMQAIHSLRLMKQAGELPERTDVICLCHPENEYSRRNIEAVGMHVDGMSGLYERWVLHL